MSNKNIAIQKYKRPSAQQIKTTNSGIFKDGSKMIPQYSKNNNKIIQHNMISRHASEEEFRRRIPTNSNNSPSHNLTSA